jgi:ABC-type antimicrobial peptide transport system permease subunit
VNPLSPLTYYLRHKRSAIIQIALISLATVGIFVLVAVLDAVPQRANVHYLTKLSRVLPSGDTLNPAIVAQLHGYPDITNVIPDNGLVINLPTLIGTDSQRLMGVTQQDAEILMQHCGVRLKEGRMFEPHSNEFVISEEIARALDLRLGSEIGRTINKDYYGNIPTSLVLVGTLEGDPRLISGSAVRLGFISAEYLDSHELYAPRLISFLVLATEGRETAVDEFLETTIQSRYTEVETFALLMEVIKIARTGIYVVFGVVNSLASVVVAFVIGTINRIAVSKRLNEFGVLYALGYTRKLLTWRLLLETTFAAGFGCLIGLGGALLAMTIIKNNLFYNLGMELDLANPAPFYFVLPIPSIIVALTYFDVQRIFARLDAIAIVEQGKLSEEENQHQRVKKSSSKPLSSLTFYLRHRRRGVLMIVGTTLMLLGVTLPVFLLSAMQSAMSPYMDYLQYVSVISPIHDELDPVIVGQIRGYPAVARSISAIPLGIQMVIPPAGTTDVRIFGVSVDDMVELLALFGLEVQEGRLPRPNSNEIVISEAIAANRSLHVGDIIGGDSDDERVLVVDDIPTEMTIVGILSPGRPWVGLAPYEYLRDHELTALRSPNLLVIPRERQKQTMDDWLESGLETAQIKVVTLEMKQRDYRNMMASLGLIFTLLECMIAAIAAIALATLNHIFFDQRKEEFGVLNAVGHSRWRLVARTLKETFSMVGVAWVFGVILCGISLVSMQNLIYNPRGLNINYFIPTPWLLTLPIPLAVILASVLTIVRMLNKLDPVAVIERRLS